MTSKNLSLKMGRMSKRPRNLCGVDVFVLIIGVLIARAGAQMPETCPKPEPHSAKDISATDIKVPATMHRPLWPANRIIYQRVLPASAERVTPFLNNNSAQQGTEILNLSILNLPTTAQIVDVSVRVRAVQQYRSTSDAPVVELGTRSPRPPTDSSETCRLAEYGNDWYTMKAIPYPVMDAGSSSTIDWSMWVPTGVAHISLSNNSVVLSFNPTQGNWNHRYFWDAVVYYVLN